MDHCASFAGAFDPALRELFIFNEAIPSFASAISVSSVITAVLEVEVEEEIILAAFACLEP